VSFYLFIPIAFYGLAMICIWRYPLTRRMMGRIREDLEARRGAM